MNAVMRRQLPVYETLLGKLYEADCLEVLPGLASDAVDTIFADPPFNLGKDYGGRVEDFRTSDGYVARAGHLA